MAVSHSTAARNAATDAVVGTLGASPRLTFRVGGTVGAPGTVAATLVMSATPFPAAVTGTATANAITSDTNAAGNASAVNKAALQTSGGTVQVYCDVAASGSDINMTNGLVIAAGDTVSCSSLTYTALSA
jgi:hypothetical protein